jgi:hypothetical protein
MWLMRALGKEKGRAVWAEGCAKLGVAVAETYAREEALAVLVHLSSTPGDVGIAARFTRTRVDVDAVTGAPRYRTSSTDMLAAVVPPSGVATPRPRPDGRYASESLSSSSSQAVDLVAYLTPGFSDEEAKEAIARYAKQLRLDPSALSRTDAVSVLDIMSRAPGLVGVVASFAKVKFFLRNPA